MDALIVRYLVFSAGGWRLRRLGGIGLASAVTLACDKAPTIHR